MTVHALRDDKSPRDLVWDTLTAHFGEPRMDTERKMFGRVVAELLRGGATAEETTKACSYVLANFDSPSVNAVPKWFSVAQNGTQKKSAQQMELDRLRQLRLLEMCGEKRKLIQSYKPPDRMVDGVIVPGVSKKVWSTCGKRPGHKGDHGPWPRWRMYLNRIGL